jgi:hypothetical protein|tara:strand:- start:1571 stop:1909 length:339 start_codon:yes stop_codon:yes gene_type:complete
MESVTISVIQIQKQENRIVDTLAPIAVQIAHYEFAEMELSMKIVNSVTMAKTMATVQINVVHPAHFLAVVIEYSIRSTLKSVKAILTVRVIGPTAIERAAHVSRVPFVGMRK